MAMGRFNRPSIMVYGGSIAPGRTTLLDTPEIINISTTFEAYGALLQGKVSEKSYQDIIRNACPGAGACGGLYTASTSTLYLKDFIEISGIRCGSDGNVISW
jgi:dihydroxy-acid dehydratase